MNITKPAVDPGRRGSSLAQERSAVIEEDVVEPKLGAADQVGVAFSGAFRIAYPRAAKADPP